CFHLLFFELPEELLTLLKRAFVYNIENRGLIVNILSFGVMADVIPLKTQLRAIEQHIIVRLVSYVFLRLLKTVEKFDSLETVVCPTPFLPLLPVLVGGEDVKPTMISFSFSHNCPIHFIFSFQCRQICSRLPAGDDIL